MTILTRAQFAKQLVPGLNAIFGTAYKSIDNEHTPLFDVERFGALCAYTIDGSTLGELSDARLIAVGSRSAERARDFALALALMTAVTPPDWA